MSFNDTNENFFNDCKNILGDLEVICKQNEDICEEWKLTKLIDDISPNKLYKDVENEILYNNIKIGRKETICVVYGRVGSGKSTVINALLGRQILPTNNCLTKNNYVKIKKSDDNTEYVIYNDSKEKVHISSLNKVDLIEGNMPLVSNAQVFLSGNISGVLKDNVIIYDTPGIGSETEVNINIHEICMQADFLILVVNSTNDISEIDKDFLLKSKTKFSKFKLIIIFNHWDKIKDSKKDFFIQDYSKSARKFLCHDLEVQMNHDDEGIFFISALEKVNLISHEPEQTNEWEKRDQSFNDLIKLFNQYCDVSVEQRQLLAKETNIEIISDAFKIIKNHITVIQERFTKKVQDALCKLFDVNEIINKTSETLFSQNYKVFFRLGLNTIQINERTKLDNSKTFFNISVNEHSAVMMESLKIIINDLISRNEDCDKDLILKIFEKLYFYNYITKENMINLTNTPDLYQVFNDVLTTIRRRRFIIAGFTVLGTLIPALIGVAMDIGVSVARAIVIPLSVAITVWMGSAKLSSLLFKSRYTNDELEEWWNCMKARRLIDSYQHFSENLPEIILKTISMNRKDLGQLERDMNEFNDKWKNISAEKDD